MNGKEALIRVKTGYFDNGRGFDMQLLVDAVGAIGEMFRSGQIIEVVRCKDCKYGTLMSDMITYMCESPEQENRTCIHEYGGDWFCADAERR